MSEDAIRKLRELDYEVIEKHYTQDELLAGVLNNYDAVIVRSATKLNGEVLSTIEEVREQKNKFEIEWTHRWVNYYDPASLENQNEVQLGIS